MIKKEKIFELKIEEDDELSGVDAVSLVDEPAIEINWLAFNKTQEDFFIPDGEDIKFSSMITSKGQSEDDLINDGWDMVKEDFISSSPNSPSFEDTEERLIRYKYVLNPQASGSPIMEKTREFCKDLLQKNLVYRVEDLEGITNDLGSSAMVWRGSFNCRHLWKKIEYRRGDRIVNKGSSTKGRIDGAESYDVLGLPQPDTRVPGKASFGYDNNLPSYVDEVSGDTISKSLVEPTTFDDSCPPATQDVAINLKNRQECIDVAHYGPLNPNEPNEEYWKKKADMFGGDLASAKKALCGNCAFFVRTQSMLDCIAGGINDTNEWDTIDAGEIGYCEAFDFKCAGSRTCDAWVVGGPIVKENMKSYSDYPESASNNACKVLRWRDEHGDEVNGMTQIGWTRANQLCNKENISEETIARMASFARHRENAEVAEEFKSTPWKDKGYVAWLGWGGTTGIEWAQNKLESIRNNMSKQHFKIDSEEKRIVLGPTMIPDQKIFRKDAMGNPYYVFFTAETIRMISEKYMKNQYTRNNDLMHDGKAVRDVYVIESWIKEDENDKSVKYGFGDVPVGTWMIAMKIAKTPKGDEVWNQVKEGKLNGFSVSGFFEEVQAFSREEMFLYKVAEILKKY